MNEQNEYANPDQTSASEAGSNIFLNLNETDSTGIPSLKSAPESVISTSVSESRVNAQMAVALGVIAIGAGVIYAMRYIGMKAGLDDQVVAIDYASQSDNAEFNKRFEQMLSELDESTVAVQFDDHEAFVDAPFARPRTGVTAEPVRVDPGMSEADRLALQRQRELDQQRRSRAEAIEREAMSLRLMSMVGGTRPAARVSGQTVTVGSKLGEYFTVTEITGRSVIVEADGMRFEIVLGQETTRID